jgi:hypothetical protein
LQQPAKIKSVAHLRPTRMEPPPIGEISEISGFLFSSTTTPPPHHWSISSLTLSTPPPSHGGGGGAALMGNRT